MESAKNGHVNAQVMVANNYTYRYMSSTLDADKMEHLELAKFWYEKSISSSSVKAKRQYGNFLMYVDIFSVKAEKLLKEASSEGDLPAMNSLGLMYAYRWDKTNDENLYRLAKSIFEESIRLGYEKSESDLAELINHFHNRKFNQ
ncbi:hypothetical protein [Shewanella gelidii]|uniref:Sel1 repeat family protein n=1 Tax=Shewanella gelidii TaxID=1642821 RepID=A0A917JKU0_9GAMM|nr:hypothetical protein [Shewanella gelidii]MCL1097382.1 hypothetical protein [Shewanella gelidii]GGI74761.1 hypothetical protein GCM10009332_10230 [Shewanella gelidii]